MDRNLFGEAGAPDAARQRAAARWLELTRAVLPGMAREHRWPIHLDHCFMRVCLDAALGAPWTATVRRPALRHMTDAQLAAALAVAEEVAARPERLPALNAASIDGRRAARERDDRGPA
ncbi:hypothetical protein [Lichenibacterium dinghuense]|uniref:hypothetical protein n=1 Tax=Lichenibacterium dinghuense TaxID=2895977 RepID=UPI001F2EEB76|nr:hypothetical protein [Lichenibacterium sp. 6Y81]